MLYKQQQEYDLSQKKKILKTSSIVQLVFSTAFFPRLLDAAGAPSIVNFIHFFTVPFAFVIALTTVKTNLPKQKLISQKLLFGIMALFITMNISAFVNEAGAINLFVDFLLLGEPYIFLLTIVCIPMSAERLKAFKQFVFICASINLLLALIQKPLIDAGLLYAKGFDGTDGAQGVFFVSGAGNYVSATVSIMFALYYFKDKAAPIWLKFSWLIAAFAQLIISDSKQIIISSGIAFLILAVASVKDLKKAMPYITAATIGLIIFLWSVENIPALAAFNQGLIKFDQWGPDGAARDIKTAPFRIATSYYTSILNWLFGLGPGHTFGRMGGWFLRDYANIFIPLYGTRHPASADAWDAVWNNWIAVESTLYSPFFGWAGIWGDLGLVGLGTYLYLASIVWRNICLNDLSKFLMLVVFVVGLIFTQMEEPGFMLFVALLIGLQWQEKRLSDSKSMIGLEQGKQAE